ncbi:hypothetical protein QBC37DRAFT_401497 [Rhypophila decipiens]|uniref:Uncharacterized protein n=1 Tax=Rhypophila decipiens TaxID=261697 RepID=A0AAN6Y993_9PEZI|nr:hypothetical protein QBC37DRAFT_401497 [Rhypophila decipiens]
MPGHDTKYNTEPKPTGASVTRQNTAQIRDRFYTYIANQPLEIIERNLGGLIDLAFGTEPSSSSSRGRALLRETGTSNPELFIFLALTPFHVHPARQKEMTGNYFDDWYCRDAIDAAAKKFAATTKGRRRDWTFTDNIRAVIEKRASLVESFIPFVDAWNYLRFGEVYDVIRRALRPKTHFDQDSRLMRADLKALGREEEETSDGEKETTPIPTGFDFLTRCMAEVKDVIAGILGKADGIRAYLPAADCSFSFSIMYHCGKFK